MSLLPAQLSCQTCKEQTQTTWHQFLWCLYLSSIILVGSGFETGAVPQLVQCFCFPTNSSYLSCHTREAIPMEIICSACPAGRNMFMPFMFTSTRASGSLTGAGAAATGAGAGAGAGGFGTESARWAAPKATRDPAWVAGTKTDWPLMSTSTNSSLAAAAAGALVAEATGREATGLGAVRLATPAAHMASTTLSGTMMFDPSTLTSTRLYTVPSSLGARSAAMGRAEPLASISIA
mmetsp:Transcript_15947/g.26789  ORF Transcript_15947/g.26789 Transcript_15947/m.26789 type:complete len:235 (+) Transcript_15947:238-942(+)